MVVAKFGGFARSGAERPALLDHGLTWQWRGIDAVGRNEMDGKSQRAPAEFAPSKDAATRPICAAAREYDSAQISPERAARWRRIFHDRIACGAALTGFERGLASVRLRAVFCISVAIARVYAPCANRERSPGGAFAARTAVEKSCQHRPAHCRNPTVHTRRSRSPRAAESREQSAALFRFDRTTTPMRKDADHGAPSGQPRFVSPVLAGIPVSEMSANRQNLVRAARGSVATRFAISSETSSWRLGGASRSLGDFPSPTASPVQAWAPEPFHAEFFSRDIRVNPLGRAGSLAATLNSGSAAAFSAPSFDLSLQLPKTPAASDSAVSAIESSPRRSLTEGEEGRARSANRETQSAAAPQSLTVPEVADRVYRLLERRLVIERERRGVFRT